MTVATSLYDIPLQRINGDATSLTPFRGKVLLIVNVASKCGLTPQYDALEKLYSTYKHCGFEVLGFPTNDFAGQEPGSNDEIATFCKSTFGVDFPMFSKISVLGPDTHPLYDMLIDAQPVARVGNQGFRAQLQGFLDSKGGQTNPAPGILWNFEKFVVNRRGEVTARFAPDILPDDPVVIKAIEAALPPL